MNDRCVLAMERTERIKEGVIPDSLPEQDLKAIDAYWRAANYLSVDQIYLYDNPLHKQPLELEHIKPGLLGHWGTSPGLNFIYAHLNGLFFSRTRQPQIGDTKRKGAKPSSPRNLSLTREDIYKAQ
jgi:XFP N-terminal domain